MATISARGMPEVAALFRRFKGNVPALVQRAMTGVSMDALAIIQSATRSAPPANPRGAGSGGAFNTGAYLLAWKTQVEQRPGSKGVLIYNTMPYAPVIEYGRRAGARQPPSEPIARWAQRKLGLPYERAKSVGFLIARRIKRYGLKPRYVMTNRVTQFKFQKAVEENLLRELLSEMRGA